MKNKKYSIVAGIVLISLQGCISTGEKKSTVTKGQLNKVPISSVQAKDEQFIQRLAVLKQRNPEKDAQQAIAKGDKRFIAKAGRGLMIPSIDAKQYAQLQGKCGLQYKEGFGDFLYREHHQRYYNAMMAYAAAYNTVILAVC